MEGGSWGQGGVGERAELRRTIEHKSRKDKSLNPPPPTEPVVRDVRATMWAKLWSQLGVGKQARFCSAVQL